MPARITPPDDVELPRVEALLAATLALMTGYSQALQAELHPEHRLRMGTKIGVQLAVLTGHPLLSENFRRILAGLQQRWQAMSECTAESAPAPRVGAGALPARLH
jgi:hypothetical protein